MVHAERRRAPVWDPPAGEPPEGERVRHRDLAALVYPGPLPDGRVEAEAVLAHHHRLDLLLQRATVVPAPYGIAFRGTRDVARFLRGCYVELGDALVLVEGRWEFRVHLRPVEPDFPEAMALDLATQLYAELRRGAHAAIPLPRSEPRVFTAAFLVERLDTRRFLEQVEELASRHPEVSVDTTGPWPAYDFVAIRP